MYGGSVRKEVRHEMYLVGYLHKVQLLLMAKVNQRLDRAFHFLHQESGAG